MSISSIALRSMEYSVDGAPFVQQTISAFAGLEGSIDGGPYLGAPLASGNVQYTYRFFLVF